jgi:cell division protein FtsI (penicillin-binding protein 3)
VIFDQFEPGSILKVFAVSALLDKKLINKTDHFFCNGSYTRDNVTVECPGVHGVINYYDIIKYSCNAGMLEAAERINPRDFYNYLKSFGFSMRTSVELPGEQPGFLRDIKEWSPRSMYAIPIGQEISVNALQVARASTTFINDGVMIEPYVVKKVFDKKNKLIYDGKRKEIRRVLSQGISQEIINAMKSSTEPGGTNFRLNIEGIDFAAKSGTGQIYDYETKKYSNTEFTSSLLVIFPAYNPRYILYVVFQKPRGTVKWGGVIGSKLINDFLGMLTGYLDMSQDKGVYLDNKDIKMLNE